MSGFKALPRRQRRAIVAGGVAVAAIAGFTIYNDISGDEGQPLNVDFALGGGSDIHGKSDKLAIRGRYQGLAADPNGTVYLFTRESDGTVMWRKKPSGAAERINVTGLDDVQAEQAAVAPDGSVYLAADHLWKVSPEGKASKVVKGNCKDPDPHVTVVSKFCAGQITGVTTAKDGSVYIGDQPSWGDLASYVHKVDGDSIELVAGRPPKRGESYKRSNPAVKNGIDPATGTKAKDVLVTDRSNSGWLASDKAGLYWRTGPGIVRINKDSTLSPFVAAKAPDKVGKAESPFTEVGRALDATIPPGVLSHSGGLAAVPGSGEVYYVDGGEKALPTLEGDFRWRGVTSDSQKKLLESSEAGGVVYRVHDGKLAPVIAGVQAITASKNSLYVAVTTDGGNRSGPENWDTAVLRVRLPR
ncbi:hypothetical protein ACWFRJ_26860 [Streptomyces sp. NPDC055239]